MFKRLLNVLRNMVANNKTNVVLSQWRTQDFILGV